MSLSQALNQFAQNLGRYPGVWSHQQRQIAPWALFGPLEGLSNSTG